MTRPTLVLIPCLSGAPWEPEQLTALSDYPMVTFRLDDRHTDIEAHADDALELTRNRGPFVLVGDSFGAQVALAAAVRRPHGLAGLVMSGGFAANPITDPVTKLKVFGAGLMPGPLYNRVVVPMHADLLVSRFDDEGDKGWTKEETIALFRENTSWVGYGRRSRAAMAADYRAQLARVQAPTLILTPEDDQLIGREAAGIMRNGIARADEVVIPRSGHMFRFSHPATYSQAIRDFLDRRLERRAA